MEPLVLIMGFGHQITEPLMGHLMSIDLKIAQSILIIRRPHKVLIKKGTGRIFHAGIQKINNGNLLIIGPRIAVSDFFFQKTQYLGAITIGYCCV